MARKPMSPSRRFAVWRRDGFKCTYCLIDATLSDVVLEVDHILAVSLGGSDEIDNLTTACRPCNQMKGPHGGRLRRIGPSQRQFSVNVDEDHHEIIERHARARRISVAQVIREAVAEWIERHTSDEAA